MSINKFIDHAKENSGKIPEDEIQLNLLRSNASKQINILINNVIEKLNTAKIPTTDYEIIWGGYLGIRYQDKNLFFDLDIMNNIIVTVNEKVIDSFTITNGKYISKEYKDELNLKNLERYIESLIS